MASNEYYYSDDEEDMNYEEENMNIEEEERTELKETLETTTNSVGNSRILDLVNQTRFTDLTQYFQINFQQTFNIVEEFISKVSDTLNLPFDNTLLLLSDNRWSEERIYQNMAENSDYLSEYFSFNRLTYQKTQELKEDFCCLICGDNSDEILGLGCEHVFCLNCYQQYLEINVNEGVSVLNLKCPFSKCKHRILPFFYQTYCSPQTFEKYKSFLVKNYLECKKSMRYCKNPCCSQVFIREDNIKLMGTIRGEIKRSNNTCKDIFVECLDCKNRQCFRCNEEDHYPVTCHELEQWNERDKSDGQTMNWIVVNTKKCPECKHPIEKNQGCRHMKCTNCNYHFCWDCMHKWDTNCGYSKSCNGIVKEGLETDNDKKIKTQAATEIQHYLKHYQAFMKQKDAIKFALKLKDVLKVKKEEWKIMQGAVNMDGEYLLDSLQTIIWSRNILKNINIWTFFMTDNNKKQLVNHYYDDLINRTEYLTYLIERPVEDLEQEVILNMNDVLKNSIKSITEFF